MKKMNFKIATILAVITLMIYTGCTEDPVSKQCTVDCDPETGVVPRLEGVDHYIVYDITLPSDTNDVYRNVSVPIVVDSLLKHLSIADAAALTAALGTVDAGAQVDNTIKFYTKNGSTKFDNLDAYTANGLGYWYDKNGDVTTWGAEAGPTQAALYVEFDAEAMTMVVGQRAKRVAPGDSVSLYLMFSKGNDTLALILDVKMGPQYEVPAYVDPETAPAGSPVTVAKTYDVTKAYTNDWSSYNVDVKEDLRNAFKMTTFQIHQAIEKGDVKFYGLNVDGTVYKNEAGDSVSTANAPGHWIASTGGITTFGDVDNLPAFYSELHHDNELLEFAIGNHPDNAKAGDQLTFTQVAESKNGGKVTFTFNVKLE
jgi:hypothetical protein